MTLYRHVITILGATCIALSLELCYIPHKLLDGGMTGLAVILGRLSGIQPVYLLMFLNAVCLFLGARKLGTKFIYSTTNGLLTLGTVLFLVEPLPRLLPLGIAVILGGIGIGVGVALILRAGGAIDGCDILGLLCQARFGLPIVWFLPLSNALVFSLAVGLYGHAALNSIIAQGIAQLVLALLLSRR